jgi:UDP-N-acetylmuramoyl-L-alanyl-D-glutamate--2,6-diaminopimelate ligase
LSKKAFALTNIDDRNGEVMVQNTVAKVSRYSLRSMAEFRCKVLEMLFDGMLLDVCDKEVWVQLLGRFNAYNLLAVYGAAMLLGKPSDEVLQAMSALRKVNGRFEPLRSDSGITAIVDYAHTPDALENVIATINDIRREGQKLYVVCGCGGDRDAAKRPEMGRIASREADVAIFTSDNPRTEDPEKILDQMEQGKVEGSRTLRISDREQALRTAVMLAREGDIILAAGKGHETYQIIGTEKRHFDDREVLREAFGIQNSKLPQHKVGVSSLRLGIVCKHPLLSLRSVGSKFKIEVEIKEFKEFREFKEILCCVIAKLAKLPKFPIPNDKPCASANF